MAESTSPKTPTNKTVRLIVMHYLKRKAPSGYSLLVPEDGVMRVTDGVTRQHDRWYVQVVPEPEYIAETRRQEFLGILGQVQEQIHKERRWTVYLTSMLPVV